MAELFNIGGWILTIVTFIGGYFLGKRREKQQNKRELILDMYPTLIENLRLSIPQVENKFLGGYVEEYKDCFEVLVQIDVDARLRIIESLDKDLYTDLRIVLDEIIPSLDEVEEKRKESWLTIYEKWLKYIREKEIKNIIQSTDSITMLSKLPNKEAQKITSQARSAIIWKLWRNDVGDIPEARAVFHSLNGEAGKLSTSEKLIIFENFKDIARDEWEPIKSNFKTVCGRLKELVEKKILPRMERTLSDIGK